MKTASPPLQEQKTQVFQVSGMHCASCVNRIETALQQALPQLDSVSVNLATEQVVLQGEAPETTVLDTLQQLGYQAKPISQAYSNDEESQQAQRQLRLAITLTVPVFVVHMAGLHFAGAAWLQLALSSVVLFYCGLGIFKRAWQTAKQRATDMDTLIALGAGTAWLYSVIRLLMNPATHETLYFETATMIVTLILLGRYLETRARRQTGTAIQALMQLQPETALIQVNHEWQETPVARLLPGEVVMVRPGSRIPVDGVVIEGQAWVNESMMTGESVPAEKTVGDSVIGGTLNESGNLVIRVTKVGAHSTLSRIIELVTQAQTEKPPVQKLADRIAGIFVPIVLGIAAVTFSVWLLFGHSVEMAVRSAVAVLVISCPCALGLATPTAIQVGLGRGAQEGILIRSPESIELAAQTNVLMLDKTGTLTHGHPEVTQSVHYSGMAVADCLALIAAVEDKSEHPYAKALVRFVKSRGYTWTAFIVDDFKVIVNGGVQANVNGRQVLVGSPAFLSAQGLNLQPIAPDLARAAEAGESVILAAIDHELVTLFALQDTIRRQAKSAITALRALHIQPVMLTGDRQQAAEKIGEAAGLQPSEILAELTPAEKLKHIQRYQQNGKMTQRQVVVGMVGDGINDAPALAQADFSIAMGTGTDIAMQTAQMTLVNGAIDKVVSAIRLSRAILQVIRQNLFWAFSYNVIAIPLAAFGLLTPVIAAAAMSVSSLTVVLNSLRLKRLSL